MNDTPVLNVQTLLDRAEQITYEDIARRFYGDGESNREKRFAYEIYEIARLDTPLPVWRIEVWATPLSPKMMNLMGGARVQVTYNMHLDEHGILRVTTWESLKPTAQEVQP